MCRIDFENGLLKESSQVAGCWHIGRAVKSPFGVPGDLLYVRETFCIGAVVCSDSSDGGQEEWYIDQCKNDNNIIPYQVAIQEDFGIEEVVWKPSIHMPRWASRITLKVERVWVERVQDVDLMSAINEGVPSPDDFPLDEEYWCPTCLGQGVYSCLGENMGVSECDCCDYDTAQKLFKNLWDSIYDKTFPWESNPWVWACEFEVIEKNVDEVIKPPTQPGLFR